MVSRWVINPIYPIYKLVIIHLLQVTIDPNLLGHPSSEQLHFFSGHGKMQVFAGTAVEVFPRQ